MKAPSPTKDAAASDQSKPKLDKQVADLPASKSDKPANSIAHTELQVGSDGTNLTRKRPASPSPVSGGEDNGHLAKRNKPDEQVDQLKIMPDVADSTTCKRPVSPSASGGENIDHPAKRNKADSQVNQLEKKKSEDTVLVDGDKKSIPRGMATKCASCFEWYSIFEVLKLSCKRKDDTEFHAYCKACLEGLFDASISDSSLFPPRCCANIIPLFLCKPFIRPETAQRYIEKKEELDTPDPIYCSNPDCAKWIRPTHIQAGIATCQKCEQKTCTTCKTKQHQGLCPEDTGVKKLLGFAEQKKWKTCPKCKNMVELSRGCYHIT